MKTESRLKKLRLEKELTQEELGNETGFSRSSISNWEFDITTISIKDALKLCDYFNVSLDYLLGFNDDEYAENLIRKIIEKVDSDVLAEFLLSQIKNQLK